MQHLNPKSVWLFFFQYLGVFFLIYFFFLSWVVSLVLSVFSDSLGGIIGLGFVNIIIWILISYGFAKLSYKYWKYELGEDAIKIEKGVLWKKYVSIPYERIQNIDIYRGILDRLLGLSDVQIQTTGNSGQRKAGFSSEGRLPGLDPETAEQLRDDLVKRSRGASMVCKHIPCYSLFLTLLSLIISPSLNSIIRSATLAYSFS